MSNVEKVQQALTDAGQRAGAILLGLEHLRLSDDPIEAGVYRDVHAAMVDLAAAQAWLLLLHAVAPEAATGPQPQEPARRLGRADPGPSCRMATAAGRRAALPGGPAR